VKLQLLSVNVGVPRVILAGDGAPVSSAIAKTSVTSDKVRVRATNIDGDGQADLRVHGGADKAVYAYPSDHWPWWEAEHRLACVPATFGENLTLRGAVETDVAIGDRFRWGDAVLEVSQPRAPCYKFAIHTKRADAPQLMTVSARSGWYFRVIEEGDAPTEESSVERILASGGPSVRDAFVALLHPGISNDLRLRVHDAAALAAPWREALAQRLAKSRK
jgi:MOSC domain-containing protein YiiM